MRGDRPFRYYVVEALVLHYKIRPRSSKLPSGC